MGCACLQEGWDFECHSLETERCINVKTYMNMMERVRFLMYKLIKLISGQRRAYVCTWCVVATSQYFVTLLVWGTC